jgi:hypothetical protein
LFIAPYGETLSILMPYQQRMVSFLLWLVLLILCWPLALLALILYPLVWLVLLPFRLLGIAADAVFDLLRALLFLPGRVIRSL